jgi:hypothetical protein
MEARSSLLQIPLPSNALPLNGRLNGALDGHLIDLQRSTRDLEVFDLALQLGDPPARLIDAADFVFRLLRKVSKLAQNSRNSARRCRRRKQMTLAREQGTYRALLTTNSRGSGSTREQ